MSHYDIFVDFGQRAEIVQWVNQGGGHIVDDKGKQNVHFTIECHGLVPRSADVSKSTYVSSHWIRSCLEVFTTDYQLSSLYLVNLFFMMLFLIRDVQDKIWSLSNQSYTIEWFKLLL